jgi:hypothetical protein
MSSPKYASITASILARKGEAQPWNQTGDPAGDQTESHAGVHAGAHADGHAHAHFGMAEVEKIPRPWHSPAGLRAEPPPPPPTGAKEKSCMLRMSAHDFERLGILAIKTGSSRGQLLKDALSEFLANRADEYGCSCLGACENGCDDL